MSSPGGEETGEGELNTDLLISDWVRHYLTLFAIPCYNAWMTRKESHRIEDLGGSLEGCWKLAGGNTPGSRANITLRLGGALERRKAKQAMQPRSTLNSDCYPMPGKLLGGSREAATGLRAVPATGSKIRGNRVKTGRNRLKNLPWPNCHSPIHPSHPSYPIPSPPPNDTLR